MKHSYFSLILITLLLVFLLSSATKAETETLPEWLNDFSVEDQALIRNNNELIGFMRDEKIQKKLLSGVQNGDSGMLMVFMALYSGDLLPYMAQYKKTEPVVFLNLNDLMTKVSVKHGLKDTSPMLWLEELAEKDNITAQRLLWIFYRKLYDKEIANEKGVAWLKRAALNKAKIKYSQPQLYSLLDLGHCYSHFYHHDVDCGFKKDFKKAEEWYLKASTIEPLAGDIYLAELYRLGGPNLEADPEKARLYTQKVRTRFSDMKEDIVKKMSSDTFKYEDDENKKDEIQKLENDFNTIDESLEFYQDNIEKK